MDQKTFFFFFKYKDIEVVTGSIPSAFPCVYMGPCVHKAARLSELFSLN